MNPYSNQVFNVPGPQPFRDGGLVKTSYGIGKILNIYYKNIEGQFHLYATILVAHNGGMVYDQQYGTLQPTSNNDTSELSLNRMNNNNL